MAKLKQKFIKGASKVGFLNKEESEEVFNRTMAFAKGEESIQQLIRVLTAYGAVHTIDLANELEFYNSETKKLKIPDDPVGEKFPVGTTITRLPKRILDIINEEEATTN